jgi:hypothetical protein
MVCYVPAASNTFLAFFTVFLLWPFTVLMKQTRQVVRAVKQSILFRCLWLNHLNHSDKIIDIFEFTLMAIH